MTQSKKGFNIYEMLTGKNKLKKVEYDEGLKVIGAGYGRTGTSSLKKALEILFNAPCFHMSELIQNDNVDIFNKLENKTDLYIY